MHFEILVEDASGKKTLEVLARAIVGPEHTVRVIDYKGIGRIPSDLRASSDPRKRILLDQLPRLLRVYGKTFAAYPPNCPAAVIVVCDLDDKCLKEFRRELPVILRQCDLRPETRFCIAVEEGEAWLLGGLPAVRAAYPRAKCGIHDSYANDNICGTWERLADAVHPGGSAKLEKQGWQQTGKAKFEWAEKIAPHMSVDKNDSPSFRYFRDKLRELAERSAPL